MPAHVSCVSLNASSPPCIVPRIQTLPRARRGWSRTRLAGHLPLLYFSAARSAVLRLGDGSLPLGLLPSAEYPSHSFETDPDDLLLIVTDGVVEVMDGNAKEFGLERVESLVTENCANPLKAIASSIFEAAP